MQRVREVLTLHESAPIRKVTVHADANEVAILTVDIVLTDELLDRINPTVEEAFE